jgi:hypothetical protein
LGAGYEVLLILDALLGCPNFFLEVFQLPLQRLKSLGMCRSVSFNI